MAQLEFLYKAATFVGELAGANIREECPEPFVSATKLLETVKPGDLIEFDRGYYRHWAMYSDEPGYVINIPAEDKRARRVQITKEKLVNVAGSSKVRVNNQEKGAVKLKCRRRSPAEALEAAKAEVGKTLPYSFVGTNCEYYSTKWLYGNGFCLQVREARLGAVDLNSVLAVLTGIVVGIFILRKSFM